MESQNIIEDTTIFLLNQNEIKSYSQALWCALDLMKEYHGNQTDIDNLEELSVEFSKRILNK